MPEHRLQNCRQRMPWRLCVDFKRATLEISSKEAGGLKHKGHFPLGGILRAEGHFLLSKDRLAESGRKDKKNSLR